MAATPLSIHSLALAAVLALAGCASTPQPPNPEFVRNDTLPALATSASAQVHADLAIERWWLAFGDAHLDALIDSALKLNTDLEAALARAPSMPAWASRTRASAASR